MRFREMIIGKGFILKFGLLGNEIREMIMEMRIYC
jgi:hypothetical protein